MSVPPENNDDALYYSGCRGVCVYAAVVIYSPHRTRCLPLRFAIVDAVLLWLLMCFACAVVDALLFARADFICN